MAKVVHINLDLSNEIAAATHNFRPSNTSTLLTSRVLWQHQCVSLNGHLDDVSAVNTSSDSYEEGTPTLCFTV
jgi:hypothetical protein